MKKLFLFTLAITFTMYGVAQTTQTTQKTDGTSTSFTQQLRQKADKIWEAGYNHPFVQGIGKGTLEKDKFQYYLLQDYLYLLQYSKVYAFGVVKAQDEKMMAYFAGMQNTILNGEMDMHRSYMKEWGITQEQVENVEASLGNLSYTSFLLSTAATGDVLSILIATLPCTWTYYDYAARLKENYGKLKIANPYEQWINNYAQEEYGELCKQYADMIDKLAANKTPEELKALEDIFIAGMRYEVLFWETGYNKGDKK